MVGWTNWKIDFTLLQYHGTWYRTTDDLHQGQRVTQHFDKIVEVTGKQFDVIKDRRTGAVGIGVFDDLLVMQMFAMGKTFEDLPEFTKTPGYGGCIGYRDNGDLFEYSLPTGTK